MPRFFIDPPDICGGAAHIRGKDAEHLRVLRVRPGELVTLCDGKGTDYLCRLLALGPDSAEAEIMSSAPSETEPGLSCTVYAGLPKGERADFIVQKCVELGAAGVVFFLSERCVARPDGAGLKKKLERWNKIAEEASKQSGRGVIPSVGFAASFAEMLRGASAAEAGFFLWEEERKPENNIKAALERAGSFGTAAVVAGPEGGFERREAESAAEAGLVPVTLGPRILRCETAPLCALTALLYHSGDLGYGKTAG